MEVPKLPKSCVFFTLSIVLLLGPVSAAEPAAQVIVDAGDHLRIDTPVSVSLDRVPTGAEYRLEEIKDSQRLAVQSQIEPGNPLRLWWILAGTTPARAERTYELLQTDSADDSAYNRALDNGRLANEGFERCRRFVDGWLKHADPNTGLIPKNLTRHADIWNAQDAAADNYAFMVLTAAITDRPLFEGRMLDMLRAETKLTSRIGALPDTYSFSKRQFKDAEPDIGRIMYGASEYVKDGLLPLTEWLGESPWSQRMIAILDDMWKHAPVDTKYGKIVSENQEVNGEMLQTLSRIYWMTGEKKYLEWAIRLGDYYLLGEHHPTRDESKLRLRDHGCEILSGLCELYATVHFALPEKKQAYQKPIHEMLDRVLEIGRNEHGLFYNWIDPQTGRHSDGIADTWGYDLNGFYTVYLIDKTESYRRAVLKALNSMNEHYRNYRWEGNYGADGFADSIESAINLYNRHPVTSAARWVDSETKIMWSKQKPDGVIEGWHGDGNFARTTIMYCLWKTKGLTIQPWRKDVIFGAVQQADSLKISMVAEKEWTGKIIFDTPRHRTNMKMPLDWPRINQFPEWFTIQPERHYIVRNPATRRRISVSGRQLLQDCIAIRLQPGVERRLEVSPVPAVQAVPTDQYLQIWLNGEKVLRYNHAPFPPPEGVSDLYTRSGFIHPLWSPAGTVLTDIHPPDHVQHMGIWMAWPKTIYQGREIDFWNLGDAQGTGCFERFLSKTSGPVFAGFRTQHEQCELTGAESKTPVLNETWDVRVYNLDGGESRYWLWDFVSTQTCAADSPLELPRYRYGGLALRATRQWKGDNCQYLTSQGRTRKDGHGTRARWCDMYGKAGESWAGVTVMSHPDNFRHPEPMRIWPPNYKYVFFNFAPSQMGDWTMQPGKDYVFRYRFYAHQAKPVAADIDRLWNDFAHPPRVTLNPIAKSSRISQVVGDK